MKKGANEISSSKELEPFSSMKNITIAANDYFVTSNRYLHLFSFLLEAILKNDFTIHIAEQALKGLNIDKEINPLNLAQKNPGKQTIQLRKFRQELLQAFFVRFIDNFEIYLVEILREVLQKRPEILRNRNATMSLDYVLGFSSFEELIQDIIETKVNSLSYKGFLDLEQWYLDKGIPLVVKEEDHLPVIEMISTRNIIVHNRGKVDQKYIQTNPKTNFHIGDLRELQVDDLFKTLTILDQLVIDTDAKIAEKFTLEKC